MGNASDRTISTPSPVTKFSGAQTNEEQFKLPQSSNSGWTAMWPQESNNGINTSTKTAFSGADNTFSSSFATSNKTMSSAFSTSSNKSPINPFTGIFFFAKTYTREN